MLKYFVFATGLVWPYRAHVIRTTLRLRNFQMAHKSVCLPCHTLVLRPLLAGKHQKSLMNVVLLPGYQRCPNLDAEGISIRHTQPIQVPLEAVAVDESHSPTPLLLLFFFSAFRENSGQVAGSLS